MSTKTFFALSALFIVALACTAQAGTNDVFFSITAAGKYDVQLSESGDTILKVTLPNMEASDAVGLTLHNIPDTAESFEIFGSWCIPYAYAATKNYDTTSWANAITCNKGSCAGVEMEFAACPHSRKGGCSYFLTIPYRSSMKLSLTVRMAGFTLVDAGSIPVADSHTLADVNIVGKKAFNYLVQPTAALKQVYLHYISTADVMLRLSTVRSSPNCWADDDSYAGYNTRGMIQYDEFADCTGATWVSQPKLYIAIFPNRDMTTESSSFSFNLTSLLSYENAVAKFSVPLGQQLVGISEVGESAIYELAVGTVNYPGKVRVGVATLSTNHADARITVAMMRSHTDGFCRIPSSYSSIGPNWNDVGYFYADGWNNQPPTVMRLKITNIGDYPMEFKISVSAAATGSIIQFGQEFNITAGPTHYPIQSSGTILTGYLEVTLRNYEPNYYGISFSASRGAVYTLPEYCTATAKGTCVVVIPVCKVKPTADDISLHIGNYYNGKLGVTVAAKQYAPLISGAIIPKERPKLIGYTIPQDMNTPIRVRVTTLFPAGYTGYSSSTIYVQHNGECSSSEAHNTCYVNGQRQTCDLTMTCPQDTLLISTNGDMLDVVAEVLPLDITVVDASVPGASYTLTDGSSVYNDTFVMFQFPAGVSQVTLRMQNPACESCPWCSVCVNWATLDGCKFKFITCETNDCYYVLDVTSSSLLVKGRVYKATATASITVVNTTGCQVPLAAENSFCAASINYPVWPGANYSGRALLDPGASKIMTDLQIVYGNEVNPYTYCYHAIKHVACVDSYPVCKPPSGGPIVSTCKEFCQDALKYCSPDVRDKLSFLCDSTPACANVQQQPPQFVPPPPMIPPPAEQQVAPVAEASPLASVVTGAAGGRVAGLAISLLLYIAFAVVSLL